MRAKIAIKQLKRRVAKLEAATRKSALAEDELGALMEFTWEAELTELTNAQKEFDEIRPNTDPQSARKARLKLEHTTQDLALRAFMRRKHYPMLWNAMRMDPQRKELPVPPWELWSVEADLNQLATGIALKWEHVMDLALVLDKLTADDLTVMESLLERWPGSGVYWDRVQKIATPNDIEEVFAKVELDSRINKSQQSESYVRVNLPLTWTDSPLDPASFPWNKENQAEGYVSWWRERAMQPTIHLKRKPRVWPFLAKKQ